MAPDEIGKILVAADVMEELEDIIGAGGGEAIADRAGDIDCATGLLAVGDQLAIILAASSVRDNAIGSVNGSSSSTGLNTYTSLFEVAALLVWSGCDDENNNKEINIRIKK